MNDTFSRNRNTYVYGAWFSETIFDNDRYIILFIT